MNELKMLFMGGGSSAKKMLEWTAEQPEIQIVGVIGDDAVHEAAEGIGLRFMTLDGAYQALCNDPSWADIAVSYLYWRILKSPIIDVPRFGCINFHPAPLPDYRGRAGCSFAILDHLEEWGCTAHYVDAGIDTGRIIEVKRFPFDWRNETCFSLKKKTFGLQEELYIATVKKVLERGELPSTAQDVSEGRYIGTQEMLDTMEIVPGDDVDAKVQAFWFPPHEGAFITIDGKRYTLVNETVLRQVDSII